MLSLPCNLMIRRRMLPRSEGLRLHFIVNQAAWLFSALAASSNIDFNLTQIFGFRRLNQRYIPHAKTCKLRENR
jgi:hypothetical protein